MASPTALEVEQSLAKLANIELEVLMDMTVTTLKKYAKSINEPSKRDGRELPKKELIMALMIRSGTHRERIRLEKTTLEVADLHNLSTEITVTTSENMAWITQKLFEELRDYTVSLWDADNQRWKPDNDTPRLLGDRLDNWIHKHRTSDGRGLDDKTKLVYASRIRGGIRKLIYLEENSAYFEKLLEGFKAFRTRSVDIDRDARGNEQVRTAKRQTDRKLNRQTIDPTKLLIHAQAVLKRNFEGEDVNWKDLSIALSIATGRRCGEIHCTATFEPVSQYNVKFTGQLKKKDRFFSEGYVIPVLADSRHVETALNDLDEKGKRCDSPELAHSRYSPEFSKNGVKPWFQHFLPGIENKTDGEGKTITIISYHRIRDIYSMMTVALFCNSKNISDITEYLTSVLGHGEGSACFARYDANFTLSDDFDRETILAKYFPSEDD